MGKKKMATNLNRERLPLEDEKTAERRKKTLVKKKKGKGLTKGPREGVGSRLRIEQEGANGKRGGKHLHRSQKGGKRDRNLCWEKEFHR